MTLLAYILVIHIHIYRLVASPWVGRNCRFQPTCSQYSIEALQKHGLFFGSYLAVRRIISCHPWGKSGHDPVPKEFKRK